MIYGVSSKSRGSDLNDMRDVEQRDSSASSGVIRSLSS